VKRLLLLAAVGLTVAGCGGSSRGAKPITQQGPLGDGADEVWFYAAKGKPRSLVVFLHGYGGPVEETPKNHVPWLKHLAAEGSDVIYPRYEVGAGTNPYPHLDTALNRALDRLGHAKLPTVLIGYSRGGRIAVDYAAFRAAEQREPKLVLAVFPPINSPLERLIPLQQLDAKTKIVMMVGDRDRGVGGSGAHELLGRLAQANFPPDRIQIIGVKSTKKFAATHLSVLKSGPGARKAFWQPTDKLIDAAR
jgi:pimeloyl-ACP methyl ester carboxylesterase